MSRAISFSQITSSCLDGVRNAFDKYYNWSGGYWLGYAPESFIQMEIANSLSKCVPFITVEDQVREILIDAGAKRTGKLPRASNKGRIDILVWWANGTPRVLIEVKKTWNYYSINSDAKRLRQLVNRGGSQQKGIIVAYSEAKHASTLHKRFKEISNNSNTQLISNLIPHSFEDWYWDSAIFLV